jgi:hypothetical protein
MDYLSDANIGCRMILAAQLSLMPAGSYAALLL